MSLAEYQYLPFLGLVLLLFQFVPARARAAFLLLASFVFYVYWVPWHGILLATSITVAFLCGLALDRTAGAGARRALLALALCVHLGLLAAFKYGAFLTDNLNAVLVPAGLPALTRPEVTLPLGLSFYTFQAVGYVIDVWRRSVPACRNVLQFALFIAFFPQLVAGPIGRAASLLPQLRMLLPLDSARFLSGSTLILWGLLKKWVLADRLKLIVWPVFADAPRREPAVLLMTAFALEAVLYVDFSAYTDLARGSARLFGVELTQNFRRPLAARSPGEFAQRWHMSLYGWIRDYVYAPLARGRVSHASIWRNNLLVMGLFGLWHGASWTFLLWGLASGMLISVQHSWRLARTRAGVRLSPANVWGWRGWLSWSGTQLSAALFVTLFFAPDMHFARDYFVRLCDLEAWGAVGIDSAEALWIGALVALYAGQVALERWGPADLESTWAGLALHWRWLAPIALATGVALLRVSNPLPFVYFQF
jgi:alginate O-acetyltransferase complex protein AlgI